MDVNSSACNLFWDLSAGISCRERDASQPQCDAFVLVAESDHRVQRADNDPKARVNLGSLLIQLRRKDEAAEQFEAALRIDPEDQDARLRLQRLKID